MLDTNPTPAELAHALDDAIHALNAVEAPWAFDAADIAALRHRLPASRAALTRTRASLGRAGARDHVTTPLRRDRLYRAGERILCGDRRCAGVSAVTGRTREGEPLQEITRDTLPHSPARETVACECAALATATSGPLAGVPLAS